MKHLILTLALLATTIGMAEAQYRNCFTICTGTGSSRICQTNCN